MRVVINGEPWGLFTATEQVDKTFCNRRFGDDEEGNLFKGENQADLTWHGDDPAFYYDYYELKTNEDINDWSDLVAFIDALNHSSDEDLLTVLPAILDYPSLLQHMAANILFANLDAYIGPAHNYYLYHRDADGRFIHLLWDCNMAFGTYTQPFPSGYDMAVVPLLWTAGGSSSRPLAERLWASPVMVRDYYRALAAMLRTGFDSATMDARIDALADLIRADVYADTKKDYTNEQFEQGLTTDVGEAAGLKRFVTDRRAFVKSALDGLALQSDLRLNELMSVNTVTLADDAGDYDPWVEIVNLGPGRVDISQLFLTDDTMEPEKWILPGASIEDARHLVLWLDGEPAEGDNHADFRPSTTGGTLYLYYSHDSITELVDTVTYPALVADSSWGRWPDASGDWRLLHSPTPGEANINTLPDGARLVINELTAANSAGYQDESGEYEDWLEVWNAGTAPVDLGGLYLTDATANPVKWMLPSIQLDPDQFALFICDEDQEQGDRHTNFKLSKDGETVNLYSYDGLTLLDSVTFGEQTDNIAFGRCPDGGSAWRFLAAPSPGTSNFSGCIACDGMQLGMADIDLQQGDRFYLHFNLGSTAAARQMDAWVLLNVGSLFWCWPSWVAVDSGFDYQTFTVPAGGVVETDVLDFTWPAVSGSASGLVFFGAAFDEGTFSLIGTVQMVAFGYM